MNQGANEGVFPGGGVSGYHGVLSRRTWWGLPPTGERCGDASPGKHGASAHVSRCSPHNERSRFVSGDSDATGRFRPPRLTMSSIGDVQVQLQCQWEQLWRLAAPGPEWARARVPALPPVYRGVWISVFVLVGGAAKEHGFDAHTGRDAGTDTVALIQR